MIIKMNKYDFWNDLFASNKRLIVAVVEIVGGLVTVESYNLIKTPGQSRLRLFMAKSVITFFICLLLNSYISEWSPKYHYLILGVLAISCVPLLDWFLKSLLPGALKAGKGSLISVLTSWTDKLKGGNSK